MNRWMWAIAIGYPLGLAALAVFVMRRDPALVFDEYYMMGTLAIAPAFFLSLVVIIARNDAAPKLIWTTLLGLWVLVVTGAHLWFMSVMMQTL